MAYTSKKKQTNLFSSILEFIFLLIIVFLIRTFGFGLYQVPTGSMETTMLVGERFFADKLSYWFRKPVRKEIIAFNAPAQFYDYSDNAFKRLFQMYVWGPQNWTKRVVGIPGDRVKGTVEDGKPVIYLNDKKLNESYLNKYPLILVWKDNPATLQQQIEADISAVRSRGIVDEQVINSIVMQRLAGQTDALSYDPNYSYQEQPFYRIYPDRVFRSEDNKLDLRYPGTLIMPENEQKSGEKSGNYWNGSDEFYVELGPDQYWLMGDNRLGSKDCRVFGPIDGNLIHGRIMFRIWSIDSQESWWIWDLIKNPIDFWSRIRWSRFFDILR